MLQEQYGNSFQGPDQRLPCHCYSPVSQFHTGTDLSTWFAGPSHLLF